jgi:predicted PurR-regulated permease PerM
MPEQEGASKGAPFRWRARDVAIVVIAVILTVAAVKIAAPLLVPVVLGILASYALRPLVTSLEGFGMPRAAAAIAVMLALVASLSAGAYAISDDVNAAVAELPAAARKLRVLVRDWQQAGPSPLKAVKEAAKEIGATAAEVTGPGPAAGTAPAPSKPAEGAPDALPGNTMAILGVFANLAIAGLLATLILASGDAFRRKIVRVVGSSLARRRVTVEILNEIDTQVQRQLLIMVGINLLLALAAWAAFAMLGLSRAAMWAAVVGLLHFIPYLGAVMGAAIVALVALVQTESLGAATGFAVLTIGLCIFFGFVVATLWQGRACRMNAVSTFVALMFFGWLWGGWGLLIGGPLAAVVKVVADRVEGLAALGEFLGDGERPAPASVATPRTTPS